MVLNILQIDGEQTLDLRQQVLWPNETKEFCKVPGDENATHFGAYFNDSLIGVASIYDSEGGIRLRKFAVDKAHQGNGVGSAMLDHIINEVKKTEASSFWCDARESASSFYNRFGLLIEGERFFKADIPYFKMILSLNH